MTNDKLIAALEGEIKDMEFGWHPGVPKEILPRIEAMKWLAERLKTHVLVPRETVQWLIGNGEGREFYSTVLDGSPNEHFAIMLAAAQEESCPDEKT